MSEYNHELVIGYEFSIENIDKAFIKKNKGKYHMEDRYNHKTGEKVRSEKVWDEQPGDYYLVPIGLDNDAVAKISLDTCYEDGWEPLMIALEALFGCSCTVLRNPLYFEINGFVFHPKMPYAKKSGLDKIELGSIDEQFGLELVELQDRLTKYLKPGKTMIMIASH